MKHRVLKVYPCCSVSFTFKHFSNALHGQNPLCFYLFIYRLACIHLSINFLSVFLTYILKYTQHEGLEEKHASIIKGYFGFWTDGHGSLGHLKQHECSKWSHREDVRTFRSDLCYAVSCCTCDYSVHMLNSGETGFCKWSVMGLFGCQKYRCMGIQHNYFPGTFRLRIHSKHLPLWSFFVMAYRFLSQVTKLQVLSQVTSFLIMGIQLAFCFVFVSGSEHDHRNHAF